MYQDLKKHFWWKGMKIDIVGHVARCDTCNRVKAERPEALAIPQAFDVQP